MELDVSKVHPSQCAKPNCTRHTLHRHHTGSEGMWLKHFGWRKGQVRFDKFKKRYYSFRVQDTIRICDWHHEEIHDIYFSIITEVKTLVAKRFCDYSWKEANALMERLRKVCRQWLKEETPGKEPKRLASNFTVKIEGE